MSSPCIAAPCRWAATATRRRTRLRLRAPGGRHTTWRHAASSSSKPRPPASTTPASRSTGRRSGVLATAARAAFAARSSTLVEGGSRPRWTAPSTDFGREPHHGEDRALDRAQHRLVGRVGGPAQPGDHVGAGHRVERRERVGEAPQDLREDHARVAAGAHQRPVPDRLAHLLHGREPSRRRARRPPIRA